MPRPLDADELRRQLLDLPGWSGDTRSLRRTVQAPDFRTVVRMVDDVADVAEEMDHHPDIDIRYRTVAFTLHTHVRDAVTQLDVELAHRIDEVVRTHVPG